MKARLWNGFALFFFWASILLWCVTLVGLFITEIPILLTMSLSFLMLVPWFICADQWGKADELGVIAGAIKSATAPRDFQGHAAPDKDLSIVTHDAVLRWLPDDIQTELRAARRRP